MTGIISVEVFKQIYFHFASRVFNKYVKNNVEKSRVDALTRIKIACYNSLHTKMCGI